MSMIEKPLCTFVHQSLTDWLPWFLGIPGIESAIEDWCDEVHNSLAEYTLNIQQGAAAFNDPRVTVRIGDGFQYLRNQAVKLDVIITDRNAFFYYFYAAWVHINILTHNVLSILLFFLYPAWITVKSLPRPFLAFLTSHCS